MTRILVIEDHDILRAQIMQLLELTHYDVIGAVDGAEGLALAHEHAPDLVLCDIMMPGTNGFEVLQNLRRDPRMSMTPFIFLTAKSDRASLRQGMALGADDYLTKPFTTGELLSAVRARLERHEAIARAAEENLEDARRRLVHMVTHELRTPLSTINMVIDLISRQMHLMEPSALNELLGSLDTGSKRLNRLVDQIVLVSQLQAGAITRRAVFENGVRMPLRELVIGALGLARRHAYRNADATIEQFEHDAETEIICNPQALRHALFEIIANAINFSPEGSVITITQWREEEAVYLSVTDHGPGMAREQFQQALAHFQQLDRELREQQGMGLGLGLACHLIDAHGGALDLESAAGQGTTVTVALPPAAIGPRGDDLPQPETVFGSMM